MMSLRQRKVTVMGRFVCRAIGIVLAGALVGGCAPQRPTSPAQSSAASVGASAAAAADQAVRMAGRPYSYGGFSPASGFDSAGLVHYSYGTVGVEQPRDIDAQGSAGTSIDRNDLRKGDLVFFDRDGGTPSDVGIYLGDGRFVHAPSAGGKVRIDTLDTHWQERYSAARRM
jgi:cell wall-associated NlpC family hydrolase